MKFLKSENSISVAGGNMGSLSKKYICGINEYYEYNSDIIIKKYIPRDDLKQDKTIKYFAILDNRCFFSCDNFLNELDLLNCYKIIFNKRIEEIKAVDLTLAKKEILKNERLFELLKNVSFIDIINDYFSKTIFTKNVKAKLLIERGFTFNSIKELDNL